MNITVTGGFFLALSMVLFSVYPGWADEKSWQNEAELSFVQTDGNTDIRNIAAKNLMKCKFTDKLSGTWKFGILYGESGGVKNAEKCFTDLRMDYMFTYRFYGALIGGWLQDQFNGIDSRYYSGPTIGYKILAGPKHFLLCEAGLNYVEEANTDNTRRNYIGGRSFGEYRYEFNPTTRLTQSLELLCDLDHGNNHDVKSVTALINALNSFLSLKISYEVSYDNEPVPDTLDNTDTVFSASLMISF